VEELIVEGIRFNERDAELLYAFPEPASDLATIVRCFIYLNRTAPPEYHEIASCLTKAMKVGIVREDDGKYVVEKLWYDRIHKADFAADYEGESLAEFEASFVDVLYEQASELGRLPAEEEYRRYCQRLGDGVRRIR
jgi:hypothetical protein